MKLWHVGVFTVAGAGLGLIAHLANELRLVKESRVVWIDISKQLAINLGEHVGPEVVSRIFEKVEFDLITKGME